MNVLWYKGPGDFEVKKIPVPEVGDYDALIKVRICGICGSDNDIDKGVFPAAFPLVTGHEVTGTVVGGCSACRNYIRPQCPFHRAAFGKNVKDLAVGDRCVSDPFSPCTRCFHCRRGAPVFCENWSVIGITRHGGFAEYLVLDSKCLHKTLDITDEEAIMIEPMSCAIRGIDRLRTIAGVTALVLGSGPSGLLLAQLLKVNGAQKVVIASNKGIKVDTARKPNCADDYVELDRANPETHWEGLKKDYPYGFDVVVEATGSVKVAQGPSTTCERVAP